MVLAALRERNIRRDNLKESGNLSSVTNGMERLSVDERFSDQF
jgi:hypothetical protein